jgi:hypothetical protein
MSQQLSLYNRARRDLFTLLDDQDYAWASQHRWRLNNKGYAIRSYTVEGKEIVLCLHREIMQPPAGLVVDHIDQNKLNNTRANLRLLTQQQNLMNRGQFRNNTTGFKGVIYQHGKWHARIEKDGRDIHLGFYDDLKTAALVYDCAAVLLFGADIVWRNLPQQPIPAPIEALVRVYLRKVGVE